MDCANLIPLEETYDFIVARDEESPLLVSPVCMQTINEQYSVYYYDASTLPPLSIEQYTYTAIPKLFWLQDSTSLEVSGILALQNQPTLSLKGEGVLIGLVDTGIDYTNPLFQNPDGSTRILAIWDQTANRERPTNQEWERQFLYGAFYDQGVINEALQSETPRDIVPVIDENGHGTYLASLAAGSLDAGNDFIGAAPESELVVVKLKQAKHNLRRFFYLPEEEPLYQENDIMAGVAFLNEVANREGKPIVIMIALGSNQGSHIGTGALSSYLNSVGILRKRAIVVATGNEAGQQHHFQGNARSLTNPVSVEINVGDNVEGFCMELWSYAPELVRVEVQSPTGQRSQGGFPISDRAQTTNFIFENTSLTLNYRIAGRSRGDLLIFFRFTRPSKGVWTVFVYPVNTITGRFHMWLPIQPLVGETLVFIEPSPDTTITTPSSAEIPISVGAYNGLTGAIYIQSGRGFDPLGQIKPDFCAPGIDVFGAGQRQNYVNNTGTSAAAAITAGAAAQCLEWGILRGNAPGMNSVQVKNLLIQGLDRDENMEYPNPEWGYGKLDAYRAFEVLRF